MKMNSADSSRNILIAAGLMCEIGLNGVKARMAIFTEYGSALCLLRVFFWRSPWETLVSNARQYVKEASMEYKWPEFVSSMTGAMMTSSKKPRNNACLPLPSFRRYSYSPLRLSTFTSAVTTNCPSNHHKNEARVMQPAILHYSNLFARRHKTPHCRDTPRDPGDIHLTCLCINEGLMLNYFTGQKTK